jgi:hypothetical protein
MMFGRKKRATPPDADAALYRAGYAAAMRDGAQIVRDYVMAVGSQSGLATTLTWRAEAAEAGARYLKPSFDPGYHSLELTIGTDGDVDFRIKCAAPVGAACRLWCENGCEQHPVYDEDGEEIIEPLFDHGWCIATEGYFDDTSLIPELYSGDYQVIARLPIRVWWDGDGARWEWPEEREPSRVRTDGSE